MVYGVICRICNDGIYHLAIFETLADAEDSLHFLEKLWENPPTNSIDILNCMYDDIFNTSISFEEVNIGALENYNKAFTYPINTNGFVHKTTNDLTIINYGNWVDIP